MDTDTKEVLKSMIDAIINKKDADVETHFHDYINDKSQQLIKDQQKPTKQK